MDLFDDLPTQNPLDTLITDGKLTGTDFDAHAHDDGKGIVIFNRVRVNPMGVQMGKEKYPTNGEELIRARAGKLIALDGQAEARELGNPRVMNIILLGVLIRELGLQEIDWNRIIAENVKEKYVPLNQQALQVGLKLE